MRRDEPERRVRLELALGRATHDRVLPEVVGDIDRGEPGRLGCRTDGRECRTQAGRPTGPGRGRDVEADLHRRSRKSAKPWPESGSICPPSFDYYNYRTD